MVTDFFPSPTDPSFAVAVTTAPTGSSLWASHDGGKTFPAPALYAANVLITSVEIAKSPATTMYATLSGPDVARLLRSTDSGQSWTPYDLPRVNGVLPHVVRPLTRRSTGRRLALGLPSPDPG